MEFEKLKRFAKLEKLPQSDVRLLKWKKSLSIIGGLIKGPKQKHYHVT